MSGPSPAVVALVVARDEGRCVRCGVDLDGERGEAWSVQHRRARGMGGSRQTDTDQPQNLILLCGSGTTDRCHRAVEDSRRRARPFGWALWSSEDPRAVPVRYAVGAGYEWRLLDAAGGWQEVPVEVGHLGTV